MIERPILFGAEMVRKIRADQKTQTRRVCTKPITPNRYATLDGALHRPDLPADAWLMYCGDAWERACPYGVAGDRLWVREAFYSDTPRSETYQHVHYRADGEHRHFRDGAMVESHGIGKSGHQGPWKPAIYMPRWASRITLEITEWRVERLQDISGEDARAEGITVPRCGCEVCMRSSSMCPADASAHILAFAELWDSINGKRPGCAWGGSPWVWTITFKRIGATP